MSLESDFQGKLIKKLKKMFDGCVILKNDANYIQGVPDLTIFYKDRWAMLECKKTLNAKHQPNQDYYVKKLNDMSYAAFICPENEKEILNEIQCALEPGRASCPVKSK